MQALRIINKDGQAPSPEEITAAHKVANTHGASKVGVIKVTDPIDDVEVEYHAGKSLAITQGGSKAWFGYGAQVDMRCWCVGVEYINSFESNTGLYSSVYLTDGTLLGKVDSYNENFSEVLNVRHGNFSYFGNYERSYQYVDRVEYGDIYEDISGDKGGITYDSTIPIGRRGNMYEKRGYLDLSTKKDICYRYTNTRAGFHIDNPFYVVSNIYNGNISEVSLREKDGYNFNNSTSIFGSKSVKNLGNGNIETTYIKYPIYDYTNQDSQYNGHYLRLATGVDVEDSNGDFISRASRIYIDRHPDVIKYIPVEVLKFMNETDSYALSNLQRERNRRKKCSDGQLAYLRHAFLSKEFELFIKTRHPVSDNVRRDIPMVIKNVDRKKSYYDQVDSHGAIIVTTLDFNITIELSYVDKAGKTISQNLTGTCKVERGTSVGGTRYTYTNYPLLSQTLPGVVHPTAEPEAEPPYLKSLWLNGSGYFVSDTPTTYPLLTVVDGVFFDTVWKENDKYGEPRYSESFKTSKPPITKTTDNLTFTTPDILKSYIHDSKPIEFTKDAEGNKVKVTPSRDWLSSRLADKEIITVVPLNLVQGIKIFNVSAEGSPVSIVELEVRGKVVERIVGSKTIDQDGNVIYKRYYDVAGSGKWGELMTTGATKTETIISSPEHKNLLSNIASGVFDKTYNADIDLDTQLDEMVFGNCGMYPHRMKDSNNAAEIDHFIVYGYARFQFNYDTATFKFLDWTEFTEDGKITHDGSAEYDLETNPTEVTVLTPDLDNNAAAVNNSTPRMIRKTHKLAPRVGAYYSRWPLINCVCLGNKAPWTDTKQKAKDQKSAMKDPFSLNSDDPYDPKVMEALAYRLVSDIIRG